MGHVGIEAALQQTSASILGFGMLLALARYCSQVAERALQGRHAAHAFDSSMASAFSHCR